MSNVTGIEWCDATWNVTTGCTKISAGCDNCYAEKLTARLKAMHCQKYQAGFENFVMHEKALSEPKKLSGNKIVFVNSVSDLMHGNCTDAFILRVVEKIRECPKHFFLLLTKRPRRMLSLFGPAGIPLPDNCGIGVTIENNHEAWRKEIISAIKAPLRFISYEPLLEYIVDTDFEHIDWVVAGKENGSGARPCDREYLIRLKKAANHQNVPILIKGQKAGDEFADDLEFPESIVKYLKKESKK